MLNITVRDVQPDDALEIWLGTVRPDSSLWSCLPLARWKLTCSRSLAIPMKPSLCG